MAAISGQRDFVTAPSGLVITHDGLFDMDGFYEHVKAWYFRRRYDYTEKEIQIKHKVQGNEYVFGFLGEREIDEYIKFHIDFKVFSIRTKKVKEGYVGWIKINIMAYVELDWKGEWQKSPWKRFLFHLYNNFIIKDRILKTYEGKLYGELLEVIGITKSSLKAYD